MSPLPRTLKPLPPCLQPKLPPTRPPPLESNSEPLTDSITLSLQTFTTQLNLPSAFKSFTLLHRHSPSSLPLLHPLSSLLQCCSSLKTLPQGKQLHTQIVKLGFEQTLCLVPKLITFYSTFRLLAEAHFVAVNSNVLHPLPWNLLISLYVKSSMSHKAIQAYKEMVSRGINPDEYTYPSLFKACGEENELGFGMEVHGCIGECNSLFVSNALVSMYGKCGRVDLARRVFDEMSVRDVVSWNAIISGYAAKGMWVEVFELFEEMRLGDVQMNVVTWNTIAGGRLQTGDCVGALELVSEMRSRGTHVDPAAIVIALGACSQAGCVRLGKEVHGYAIRGCYDMIDTVRNSLITMYSRCNDLGYSYVLFRSAEVKTLVTWNSMIGGYALFDRSEEASFIFREMVASGFEPNYVTIASILPLCARVANLQHGRELHSYIVKRGEFDDYLLPWNSLVDMYAKAGKTSEAQKVFNLMRKKDIVTYTSLIAGLGMQGDGLAAIELFEEMNKCGIRPDHIAMVAALTACSHSGLVSQGEMLFTRMSSFYNIKPRMEHFACMVDMFGRAGLLSKAMRIIMEMPFRPTAGMWASLIGACHIHGNTDIGEWAAEALLEMKPDNSGYYVIIGNMYAAAGCWSKVAHVRKLMRDLGVRKSPGCTWVDLGNGFHPFVVGDTTNSHVLEIFQLLHEMSKLMKEHGYVESDGLILAEESFED